ncbi:MAG TPA: hypothetical protein VJB09_00415 [Candidatus Paceibacterota bacterium]
MASNANEKTTVIVKSQRYGDRPFHFDGKVDIHQASERLKTPWYNLEIENSNPSPFQGSRFRPQPEPTEGLACDGDW